MSEAPQTKFCADCKHERNVQGGAHLQHCLRFHEEPKPCVAVRPCECKDGEAWEPR